jgi:hypothetical protein
MVSFPSWAGWRADPHGQKGRRPSEKLTRHAATVRLPYGKRLLTVLRLCLLLVLVVLGLVVVLIVVLVVVLGLIPILIVLGLVLVLILILHG